jgi:membrane-bound serine protease (ClpP class)
MLIIHDEAEDRPPHPAAEAMKGLALRIDMKRRGLLLMKGTKSLEVRAGTPQREIRPYYLHDVIRSGDLFNRLGGNGRHSNGFFARSNRLAMPNLRRVSPLPTMRRVLLSFVSLFCVAAVLPAEGREVVAKGDVVVVPLSGEISKSLLTFLRRTQKVAESSGASAIIFEMNTYGGRLDVAEEITKVLHRANIPTYTYINSNAGSAGSLIALATKHIYMAPVSAIGAAAPILATGEDLPITQREKTVSYWSALLRSSALRNGHNPDIGEAFMNKEKEVKIGDRVIHPKGALLTLSAQEATEQINGKPLLAAGIADSVADLARKAGLKGNVVVLQPTGFERLALWITALAPLLLLLGMVGAYLEFKLPGVSLPGIVAVICFALFFLGHYFAGLAGWEVVALFVLGLILVLAEILLFAHSTIAFGIIGVLLMMGSILWAMVDRYPGEAFFPTSSMLRVPLLNLSAAIVAAGVVIVLLARYLPRTSVYRNFALMTAIPSGPSLGSEPREFFIPAAIKPGMQGVSLSVLRPSGKARFADHVVDVVTQGDFISSDTPITVVETDGVRVVVRAAT